MTAKELLEQLEDEKWTREVLVSGYQDNFNRCAERGDYAKAAEMDRKSRIEEVYISKLIVAIDVIKERVT